jgi:hypothetical protein
VEENKRRDDKMMNELKVISNVKKAANEIAVNEKISLKKTIIVAIECVCYIFEDEKKETLEQFINRIAIREGISSMKVNKILNEVNKIIEDIKKLGK